MRPSMERLRAPRRGGVPEDERLLHDAALREAAIRFAWPGVRLVINGAAQPVFGVAPGVYPDLVALDGTESGISWILEVETASTIAEEETWARWRRAIETGRDLILAVPSGYGEVVEAVSERIGLAAGLVYEYRFTPQGIAFDPSNADGDFPID